METAWLVKVAVRAADVSKRQVQIFGTAADVAAVTGGDLTVVADLSDFGSALGTYTVPATIENSSGEMCIRDR